MASALRAAVLEGVGRHESTRSRTFVVRTGAILSGVALGRQRRAEGLRDVRRRVRSRLRGTTGEARAKADAQCDQERAPRKQADRFGGRGHEVSKEFCQSGGYRRYHGQYLTAVTAIPGPAGSRANCGRKPCLGSGGCRPAHYKSSSKTTYFLFFRVTAPGHRPGRDPGSNMPAADARACSRRTGD